jgi:hypothetical protein
MSPKRFSVGRTRHVLASIRSINMIVPPVETEGTGAAHVVAESIHFDFDDVADRHRARVQYPALFKTLAFQNVQ